MKQRGYSGRAIILARRNFSEADRIIVVYSDTHGKVSLLAKGVRKPKSRKRGHLEIFSLIKFQAVKTNSLDLITEAESVNSFEGIRKNLKRISVAYFFVEAVGKITREGEKNKVLFNLLVEYLNKLKGERRLKALRLEFIHKLLSVLGFWPAGKTMADPDLALEEIIERKMNSTRIGKKVLE